MPFLPRPQTETPTWVLPAQHQEHVSADSLVSPEQEKVKVNKRCLNLSVDWNNLNQPVISSRHAGKIIFKASLHINAPPLITISPAFFSPSCPFSICTLFNEHICIPSLSFFWPETLYNLITDTSLQFQIPTLCQIPISCCLISIHLLLFLLLLPFPAWTSSSPASSNFLRKAPHRVLLESEPLFYARDWPLFILPNDSCQQACLSPFLCFTP